MPDRWRLALDGVSYRSQMPRDATPSKPSHYVPVEGTPHILSLRAVLQVRTQRWITSQMARKRLPADIPEVQEIMGSICDKWALVILHQLSQGTKRHGELHRGIRGISQKMLTQTLRKLEQDGLVRRTVHPIVPPRVDYALTSLGGTLTNTLLALYRWTEAHLAEIQRARRAAPSSTPGVKSTPT